MLVDPLTISFWWNLCRSEKGFGEAIEKQAKRAAFYIYWNVKPDCARSYIIAEDLEELLPLEQSREAFAMLDQDGNGQLMPKELCAAVTGIITSRFYALADAG